MANLQNVPKDSQEMPTSSCWAWSPFSLWQWVAAVLLVFVIGTWLVWFHVYEERTSFEEEIQAACHRAMPESADRCFDTVIIQRGGARR
jgi:hypothetical protein